MPMPSIPRLFTADPATLSPSTTQRIRARTLAAAKSWSGLHGPSGGCLLVGGFHFLRQLEFRTSRMELHVILEIVRGRQRLTADRCLAPCQQ